MATANVQSHQGAGRQRLDQSRSELARNILAAASTTAFCVALLNPLDVLRITWQTRPASDRRPLFPTFAVETTVQGGGVWRALFRPGIGVNAASVACSSGFRLGLYPFVKESLAWVATSRAAFASDQPLGERTSFMFFAGFLSGALGFFLATPLFAAKIQAQAFGTTQSGWQCLQDVVRSGRPFAGASILVARGALFSAGFSAGYDGTKTQYRNRFEAKETPVVHATASIVAAFVATLMAAPFDSILTRFQNIRRTDSRVGVIQTILDIHREAGPRGFFKGWSLFFARVAPLFLFQLPLYEQARRVLGMEFMR